MRIHLQTKNRKAAFGGGRGERRTTRGSERERERGAQKGSLLGMND